MKHYKVTISGKVQGVFYRDSTRRKARELGITGWVRNEPDGTVYMEAEGEKEQLDELIDWCKEGPPRARVENVHYTADEVQGFEKFEVRH
ncbi:MAG: acylphosphatase [Fulvivirga sp.]|nr:acylphosphatase [Fulvivirga sp.]